jgi:sugar phosphate isomerase/epimerase
MSAERKEGNRSMKFGCCVSSGSFMPQEKQANLTANPVEQLLNALDGVYESGYDFAEWTVGAVMKLTAEEFEALAGKVRESGRTVPYFNSFIPPSLKLTGPGVRREEIESYVDEAMRRVRALGGTLIVFGSGGARTVPEGFSMERAGEQIRDFLQLCDRLAGKHGLVVVIEPLNRKESNILNTVKEGLDLAIGLGLPHIKVLADAYHMYLEKESYGIIASAVESGMLAHVHIAEGDRSFPLPERHGSGVDFAAFFAALYEAGYQGAISAECQSARFAEDSAKSQDYVRSVWSEISR